MVGLAQVAIVADVDGAREQGRAVPYTFAYDSRLGAEAGTTDILDAFRIGFWVKDRYVGRLTAPLVREEPVVAAFLRALELVLADLPAASFATVFPHEVFGHGGRLRELGGEPSYVFKAPPPYGVEPSFFRPPPWLDASGPDVRIVVGQAGIRAEQFEGHELVLSTFRSGRINHIDSGLIVGLKVHEVFEAALPWESNDARAWTTALAEKVGEAPEGIQLRYLVGSAFTAFASPAFLFAAYDVSWRFLVRGERTGKLLAPAIGGVSFWFDTQLSPVPWGMEYALTALAKVRGVVFEATPRAGAGSGGIALSVSEWHVLPGLALGGALDVWMQPEIDFRLPRPGPGVLGAHESGDRPGVRGYVQARFEAGGLFMGVRLGGKTAGLSGLAPIAAGPEATALAGVILDPP